MPNSLSRYLLATLGVVPLLAMIGLNEKGSGWSETCPRNAWRDYEVGSVIEISDDKPPCRIRFRDTGIRLVGVADGSRPDPGPTMVVDSDGRFISANAPGWAAVISVWDARGRYLYSFGGEGDGPGEFSARGALNLLSDDRGRLHIRDGSPSWSVFSPGHEFIRRTPANIMGGLRGVTTILDGGSALAGDGVVSNRSHYFRVTDSTGALERSFGPVGEGAAGREWRRIAYHGGDTFWAGPGLRGAEAYVLEEWGIDGELLRTFERDVSWWRWDGEVGTSTEVNKLHVDRNGLLYALAWRPTDDYLREYERAGPVGEHMQVDAAGSLDEMAEYVLEVIDTRSGELLAADVFSPTEANEIVPRSFFRGSPVGYRYKVGDDGLPFVEIVTVQLVSR